MGKPTGFMEYDRCEARSVEPKERIKNFDEFHIFLSKEKQREQAARCMDCGVPFCQSGMTVAGMTSGCPLHNLVPEWNDLLYTGNYQQAYNRLHKTNNFPEFTSRVCPALCEKACTCGHWGDPVSVRDNEHGIIETAYKEGYAGPHIPKVRTGKKVAIIGSGPSGLAAADQLNQRTNVATEPGTYATNVKNVFVAGDMHRGQSLVVWAIREGREVAHDVDTSLMGYSYLSVQ